MYLGIMFYEKYPNNQTELRQPRYAKDFSFACDFNSILYRKYMGFVFRYFDEQKNYVVIDGVMSKPIVLYTMDSLKYCNDKIKLIKENNWQVVTMTAYQYIKFAIEHLSSDGRIYVKFRV